MSGYIVEEPFETPTFIYSQEDEEIVEYYSLYSTVQKKRFKKVLYQLCEIWNDVYKTISFINENSNINIDKIFMPKIYNMFMIMHKNKIDFYNEEKMKLRMNKNYKMRKLYKLKNSKSKM